MKCKVVYDFGYFGCKMVAGIMYSARPTMEAHPTSCSLGSEILSPGVKGRSLIFTTYLRPHRD